MSGTITYYTKEPVLMDEAYEGILAQLDSENIMNAALEILYRDEAGLKQGPARSYDLGTKKRIAAGSYKDGNRDGEWKRFDAFTGNCILQGNYKDDKKDGEWRQFHPATGKCTVQGNYKDGNLNGEWQLFDATTGKCTFQGNYKDNKLNGEWREFHTATGKLTHIAIYKDGALEKDLTDTLKWIAFCDSAKAILGVKVDRTVEQLNDDQLKAVRKKAGLQPV